MNNYLVLLRSLEYSDKYLDMGKTPVDCIQKAWEWQDLGYVIITSDNYVSITKKGRDFLKRNG
jgi:hypothetical protein